MYYTKINEYASRKNVDLFDNKYNGPTFYDMIAKTQSVWISVIDEIVVSAVQSWDSKVQV